MLADHMLAMPFCEGVLRYMILIHGRTREDLANQSLHDPQLVLSLYMFAVTNHVCIICMNPGARYDNPTCLVAHLICANCLPRCDGTCPMCRVRLHDTHRIVPQNCVGMFDQLCSLHILIFFCSYTVQWKYSSVSHQRTFFVPLAQPRRIPQMGS